MILSTETLNQLSELAITAAEQAGQYIRGVDRSLLKTQFKEVGSSKSSQVVTEVDWRCQDIILSILQESCCSYDLALLSEENSSEQDAHHHPRLSKDYFWCIDPLDGTLPFIEGGAGYAVSIALVARSGKPILAVVHQPTKNNTYYTSLDKSGQALVYKNRQLITHASKISRSTLTLYSDRSFKDDPRYPQLIKQLQTLARQLGYQKLTIKADAGAVVNALSVIEDNAACYIKLPKKQLGGGCLWDFSATACLAEAAGSWVSNIHGKALDLNRRDSNYMNHQGVIFASNKQLADKVIAMVKLI